MLNFNPKVIKMNYRSVMTLLSISILIFLVDFEYSAVNLSLKTIAEETGAPLNFVQWVLSSYALVWGAFILPAGNLGNIYGQRRMFFVGLCFFIAGSAIAGASENIETLIFSRIVQGLGAAIFIPPAYSITFSIIPENKKGITLGIFSTVAGVGFAIGPSLSGLILDYLNWQWIFWLNVVE
jgi:MFS family permease